MALLDVVLLLVVIFGLAYIRVPIIIWTCVIGTTLVLISLFGKLSFLFLAPFWIVFLAAAAFANIKQLRLNYLTLPLIKKLQKQMPSISETEREAIEAGNVWWEKDLFSGRPHWKKFLSMPPPKLTTEEQDFIDNQVETLCNMLNDWEILNNNHNLPESVWQYLKNEKFFGLVIPKEYGGRGFSALAHSTMVVKIATRSISAAVNTMVPNSLGPGELLLHYGTDEQKKYYLPRLAKGEDIPCFALTSPEAGSDAGSIIDKGIVCRGQYEGKEIIGIRLTWDKRYITLAPVATVLGIAFRLYDPDNFLNKGKVDLGITLCLVPTSHPGVETGNRHYPLHLAFLNGPTRGKDVFIPIDWIIGGVANAGQGWKMLMECLSIGRSISLPALSTACTKLAYRTTGAYAHIRRQFNTEIAHFEGVEEALGNIAGYTYLTESCRLFTVGAVDQHVKPSIASAIAKYHMTEMARKVVMHAMDVHAGHGIQMGPRNVLATSHLAIPVSITVEGANILTRNLIIFGQGAIRCHPYLLKEIKLFSQPDSDEKTRSLDRILVSHTGYLISNMVRTFWRGLTAGKLIFSPVRGQAARYYKQISRTSSMLAFLTDVSIMTLGGTLKRKERISARLGDILSEMYLASAVLKYYRDNNEPTSDLDYVRWCVEMCLYKIQIACDELLQNFPIKWLGKILRWIIFPYGTSFYKPSDDLHHKIVGPMLNPSEFRDRLTDFCYISKDPNDPVRRLDVVLEEREGIEPLWIKFQEAIRRGLVSRHASFEEQMDAAEKSGALTTSEILALSDFNATLKEVIKVNEFTFDLSTVVS